MQVNINRVKGSDYPYLYCVLVARPALKLPKQIRTDAPSNITIETDAKAADVHVVVIRQKTTKTSGYHTNDAACRVIFQYALDRCRKLEPAAARTST